MKSEFTVQCLDGMNQHLANVRALAGLLEACRSERLEAWVLTGAAALLADELDTLQVWIRRLEEEISR